GSSCTASTRSCGCRAAAGRCPSTRTSACPSASRAWGPAAPSPSGPTRWPWTGWTEARRPEPGSVVPALPGRGAELLVQLPVPLLRAHGLELVERRGGQDQLADHGRGGQVQLRDRVAGALHDRAGGARPARGGLGAALDGVERLQADRAQGGQVA